MDLSPPPRYRRHLDRYTVGQWFGIATAGLAVLAAVAIIGGVVAISNLSDARERVVDAVDPASRAGQDVLASYLNQETGIRGYTQTGMERFLGPYELGRAQLPVAEAALRRSVARLDDPRLSADVDAVLAAGREWTDGFVVPIRARVKADGPITDPVRADAGKARFDAVRAQVARLQSHLTTERERAKRALDTAATQLTLTFVVVGLLLVLGGGAILFVLRSAVSAPVSRLAFRTRRVAQGEFQRVVLPEGPRDIYELGEDVETMRERIVHELTVVEAARVAQESHQRELERQQHELERSNAELEQFAYVASHDLQEPLRMVSSFSTLVAERYRDQVDNQGRVFLDQIVKGAERMRTLIRDILAYSRLGKPAAPVLVDCDELLDKVLFNHQARIEESDADIRRNPLPAVPGDAVLLGQVFQNLLSNALKFRTHDARPVISIGARRRGGDWEFVVADNGIGIDPQYHERIFRVFQRLHSNDEYSGTGIGLAICRKAIQHHGGEITLESRPGCGATFRFTLPCVAKVPGDVGVTS
jgi:signal transduction histidine kinase